MLIYYVLVPILTAVLLFTFPVAKAGRLVAVAFQTVLTGAAVYLFIKSKEGVITTSIGGFQGVMGISLSSDSLSSFFILLTSFIFLIVAIYSVHEDNNRLFQFLLFIWEGLLIGIFLSRDLFNIFILVEISTVVVSVLIMFKRDKRSMYDGMFYLMVNTVALQFYLFGIGYVYKLAGAFDLNAVGMALSRLDKSSLFLPYALIFTAICLKCAFLPLFSWLPRAHGTPGAPSAVSAILSGLHIKSGIYLFIRCTELFSDISVPEFFIVAGIVTGIAGFILAISQSDIKLTLAYSTISQVGLIMIGLNINDIHSYTGSVYHIFNHAIFKSALFLCAGIIADAYGTRDIDKIRGVLRRFPLVGAAILMAILGITGAPLFNGSISKYFIMSGTNVAITSAVILINLGTIVTFMKYSRMLFGRPSTEADSSSVTGSSADGSSVTGSSADVSFGVDAGAKYNASVKAGAIKIDLYKQATILVLGIMCLIGGIFGEQLIEFLLDVRVSLDAAGYLQKIALYAVCLLLGFFINGYFKKNHTLLDRIRGIELNFRGACSAIGLFFAALLIITRFVS
ncbi:MAG: proton-conducting membrane transporter [Oscillospiraceae bacterium]|nr:proton-conducting membrane transporter [Oscillospiraceae bacterium]